MAQRDTDPFSVHEALDRAHLMSSFFSDFLAEHPFVRATPALRREADELAERLGAFYQAVGQFAFPDERQPEQLATELGISAKTLRAFLRKAFPRAARDKHARWLLTSEQIAAARQRWSKSAAG